MFFLENLDPGFWLVVSKNAQKLFLIGALKRLDYCMIFLTFHSTPSDPRGKVISSFRLIPQIRLVFFDNNKTLFERFTNCTLRG